MLSYNQFFLKCEIENLAVVLTAKRNIIIADWGHLIKLPVTSLYEIWAGKDTNSGFVSCCANFYNVAVRCKVFSLETTSTNQRKN